MTTTYQAFLQSKQQANLNHGFNPVWMPDFLYDFQKHLVEWATVKGRAAIFADCGLGKTPMQLVWAKNVVRHTNKRVLILTPLAVSAQTLREAHKFGINDAVVSRNGKGLDKITITNYERLHYFNSQDFDGVVCDESSILKNFTGATRKGITDFMRTKPYRLLCTATAAPNDYIELGTSSEALGELGYRDVITRFFKEAKKSYVRKDAYKAGTYQLRGHAKKDFWRWVCSWARTIRKPSDLGYDNDGFALPPLDVIEHVVTSTKPNEDYLFDIPAVGLAEQRKERRRSIEDRCNKAAECVARTNGPSVCWGYLNDECDMMENIIDDAVQVKGSDTEEKKERVFEDFALGNIRVLVTKPTIAGFGLNWQHCAHQTFFPSHSFEQWYQATRRSWRFGQKKTVVVDVITSEGERDVLMNLRRKERAADVMFNHIVEMLNYGLTIKTTPYGDKPEEIPAWL